VATGKNSPSTVIRRSLWLVKKKPELQRDRHPTGRLSPDTIQGAMSFRGADPGEPGQPDFTKPAAQLVAIGVSTGGPPTLQAILGGFPSSFPVPIVIVQHISNGFVNGLAKWLGETTPLRVKVAEQGERLLPGVAYLAPDDFHLHVNPPGLVWLDPSPPVCSHRPSVTELFISVSKSYGRQAVGVLLTGMGQDGAEGLKVMRQAGAYTIAQDEATSVIFGMPKVAIEIDAVDRVLSLESIAPHILQLFHPA
jgi:two-component system chemotaxis response regulator CheB